MPAPLDLTGQKFGKLTVVKRAGSSTYGAALWECSCECGGNRTVASSSLRAGLTSSCGCNYSARQRERTADLTGKRFGFYTAVRLLGYGTRQSAKWECKCDCGSVREVSAHNLMSGGSRSCGCMRETIIKQKLANGTKLCKLCSLTLPLSEFAVYERAGGRVGYETYCKGCRPENRVMRIFGLKKGEYEIKLREQDNKCAICGRLDQELSKKLSVDHNHSTGVVRGLLCGLCNTGIGSLSDSREGIVKALEYFDKYEPPPDYGYSD